MRQELKIFNLENKITEYNVQLMQPFGKNSAGLSAPNYSELQTQKSVMCRMSEDKMMMMMMTYNNSDDIMLSLFPVWFCNCVTFYQQHFIINMTLFLLYDFIKILFYVVVDNNLD